MAGDGGGSGEGGTDGSSAEAGDSRAGQWTGRYDTSANYGLSFVVDEMGRIKDFTVTGSVPPPCGSNAIFEVTATGPFVVGAVGSFSFDASGCFGNECVTYKISGKFTTDGLATGTRATSGFTNLATACFGTSSGSGPWTATKDCTHAPTLGGASKTRFCGGV